MAHPDFVNGFLTSGLLNDSPPWSMHAHLSLHGGLCCARKCFNHRTGAALDIPASPCMTPEKWSVMSVHAVSPLIPSTSTLRLLFLEVSPEKEKSMDNPWHGCNARLVV